MGVFIGYASRDSDLLGRLTTALNGANVDVTYDEELGGDEEWWRSVLADIRESDVFIVALSQNFLQSKASRAELQYAQSLGKPILPVQVGPLESVRANPLAAMQAIDYQNPTPETGIELVSYVYGQQEKSRALPDPLPPEPAMPFAYVTQLSSAISGADLSPHEQVMVLSQMKAALDEDRGEESARREITKLAYAWRDRPDITYRTRTELDSLIAELDPQPASPQQPTYDQPTADEASHQQAAAYQQPYQPQRFNQAAPRQSSRTWLFVGGGVAAAVIVVVVIVVVAMSAGGKSTPTTTPLPDTAIESLLLTADDLNAVMGTTKIEAGDMFKTVDSAPPEISNPKCSGSFSNATEAAYKGSGYRVVRHQIMSSDDPHAWVDQTVVTFPTADQANQLLKTSEDSWNVCAGQTVNVTLGGKETHWSFGDVSRSDAQIEQVTTEDTTSPWACQHVMRVVSNVIIEATACHSEVSDQARQIVDKMAAKVPK